MVHSLPPRRLLSTSALLRLRLHVTFFLSLSAELKEALSYGMQVQWAPGAHVQQSGSSWILRHGTTQAWHDKGPNMLCLFLCAAINSGTTPLRRPGLRLTMRGPGSAHSASGPI